MSFNHEMWEWLKTAPLPVVLSITLLTGGGLAGWLWSLDAEQHKQEVRVEVAVEQAKNAHEVASRLDAKLEKANEKLDKLLENIIRVKAALDAEQAAARKKEKK